MIITISLWVLKVYVNKVDGTSTMVAAKCHTDGTSTTWLVLATWNNLHFGGCQDLCQQGRQHFSYGGWILATLDSFQGLCRQGWQNLNYGVWYLPCGIIYTLGSCQSSRRQDRRNFNYGGYFLPHGRDFNYSSRSHGTIHTWAWVAASTS